MPSDASPTARATDSLEHQLWLGMATRPAALDGTGPTRAIIRGTGRVLALDQHGQFTHDGRTYQPVLGADLTRTTAVYREAAA